MKSFLDKIQACSSSFIYQQKLMSILKMNLIYNSRTSLINKLFCQEGGKYADLKKIVLFP